ncbi:ribonuclease H-like domain, reverse transcriptase, RNA-dependent DNA polymerase [Tanacetum coccineum]|uniref:Ribonuclease H-like domain, reverse transcriptase, RNA-dependent DNA polymerase n=1 Tax=Tanacetum coccineum TaxID=301880 RepID=A0ABQ4ZP73_9ASTR
MAVKVEAVIGGSSLALGPGKGIRVEKPGGGVISLPFVMPEKHDQASMEIEEFLRCMLDAESRITRDNTNGNTTFSEAQGVSLRITSDVRRNRMEQGIAHKPVIVVVFHDLRGDWRVVYHDLCLGRPIAKGVGLRVASYHTGNHREDDFTPLETIRRFLGVIESKSLLSSKGRPLSRTEGSLFCAPDFSIAGMQFFIRAKEINQTYLAGLFPNHEEGERVDGLVEVVEGVEDIGEVGNQGNVGNQNGNVVNENVQENVRNVLVNGNQKMDSVQDMSGCSIDQKVKYTDGSLVGKALTWWNSQIRTLSQEEVAGHTAYTNRFHELDRLVPHLVIPESRKTERYVYGLTPQICRMVAVTEPKTIQKVVLISGAQTDEAVRNGSIKKVFQMGLESLEARIVVHEKNEAVYEEDIAFLNAKDKTGLGYDSQMNESEVVHSVFNSRESDVDDSPVNDRFKIGEGFHAVPPPIHRTTKPSRPDLSFAGLDDSVYKTKVSETETSISKTSKDIVEKPKTVRPSAPIIEEWDTDSDNDSVFRPKSDQTKPKFTKINFVKSGENVKSVNKENTHRQVEVNNVTTAGPKAVSVAEGNGENVVKSSACWIWRPTGNVIDQNTQKTWFNMLKRFEQLKRIFRYLKGQPKLGLWYPRDSPFDLEAFFDSDYAGASLDRKSTTGGCQFLGKRLISWQCKKQTIVANSTTEAEYVAAANCCGQAFDVNSISNEFRVKTGGCKVNATRQDLVLLDLKFVDQHNMVSYLEKSEGNADFHEIMDFLTARSVHYALTQIHAIVDGKTVVISESSVRSDLHFNDEDGITCLTNDAIFENLALMGSKSTSWNEFSTNIASAVICLANGQTFNFSKLIFDEPFNDVYQTPAHTKKVFTNMKRKGKDFPRRVTPLFASMLAPPVVEGEEDTQFPQTSVPIPNVADEAVFKEWDNKVVRATTTAASLDAIQASGNISKTQSTAMSNDPLSQELVQVTNAGGNTPGSDEERIEQDDLMDFVPPIPHDSPLSGGHTPGSDDGRPNINELMTICTYLLNRVLALEQSKTAQDLVIRKLKKKSLDEEYVSKQGRKSDKTKPMFDDSDFAELDVDKSMENVEGDVKTQGMNTAEQTTTDRDTVNTASINVSAAGPSNVSTTDPSTSTVGDIFEDEMMTIADTLMTIRSTRPRTTSVIIHDVEEEPRRSTPILTTKPSSKDKGKAIMFKREQRIAREQRQRKMVEPKVPLKKKDQVALMKDQQYGLKQAPREWYDELSNFLASKGFLKGSIDPSLFITKKWEDILLVQIYVDDIIFSSTYPKLFQKGLKKPNAQQVLRMSMIEELKIPFLGFRFPILPHGTIYNQAKMLKEILNKHVSQLGRQRSMIALLCLQRKPVEKGIVELFVVRTEYQLANLFTKALPEDRFKYLVRRLGKRCLTPEELEVLENESA